MVRRICSASVATQLQPAERIQEANEKGIRLKKPYDGPTGFHHRAGRRTDQSVLRNSLLAYRWGTATPTVIDPTAGGGSIPFEAVRFGLPTRLPTNSTQWPSLYPRSDPALSRLDSDSDLADDIAEWGKVWARPRGEAVSSTLLPDADPENRYMLIRVRSYRSPVPETGKPVPLQAPTGGCYAARH